MKTNPLPCLLALLSLVTAGRAEVQEAKPAGILAKDSPAATPYYVRDSGKPGPTVMLVGGIQDTEPAGSYAADQIRHWPITRGKIIVIPAAHSLAPKTSKGPTAGDDAGTGNPNSASSKLAEHGPAARGLAAEIGALVTRSKPTWLVELYEGQDSGKPKSESMGGSVVVSPTPTAEAAVVVVLTAVNATIDDPARQFARRSAPLDGGLVRATREHPGITSMILETTPKSGPLSKRARQHRIMMHALLKHLDMIDESVTPQWLTARTPAPGVTRVALYDAEGSAGAGVPSVLEQLGRQPNTGVVCVGVEDIRGGVLDQFDVVMFTGGSGSKQGTPLGDDGRDLVKQFVEKGGGYVGICAGAYLACSNFSWGLKVLDARTKSSLWRRGQGMVKLELTDAGREIFGDIGGTFDCKYANGPIVAPAGVEDLPDFEPLAFFRTELAENNTPPGLMVSSPAIFAGHCGKGRVLCSSPHPEQTKGLEHFVPRAVAWVAGGKTGE